MKRVLWIACLVLGGCTSIVDVDGYHFDIDPCAPRPTACEGGSEYAYVVVDSDITRSDADGFLDGFNFDGTNLSICNQRDFVSPSGEPGIDNQLADLVASYEVLAGVNVRDLARMRFLTGEGIVTLRVLGVDDFTNDDCVHLEQRRAIVPEGTVLDADADGELDAGLRLDYVLPTQEDPTACIIDGVLHARFPESNGALPFGTGEFMQAHARARLSITADGIEGVFGGTANVAEVRTAFADIGGLVAIVERQADIDPTTAGSYDCISVSFALTIGAIPVELGSLVQP